MARCKVAGSIMDAQRTRIKPCVGIDTIPGPLYNEAVNEYQVHLHEIMRRGEKPRQGTG